ncbi:hypothetical protein [Algihabitans albus]|uniref:hypothetical protein n=1 Tax=Algihabitans albus TaxID=2164067 RepID=UPI001F263982|nr:hypothetical protein [Algihabitans albus]
MSSLAIHPASRSAAPRPWRRLALASGLLLTLAATGCSGLNETEQRTLTGGAIGAGVGTVGTVITGGCVACGAAVGGAVGAGVGYLSDKIDNDN